MPAARGALEAAADRVCRENVTWIEVETVEQLAAHGYTVSTFCHACKRVGPLLDLQKYIDQGRGDLRPIDLKLKHKRCGKLLGLTIHAAKGYGK